MTEPNNPPARLDFSSSGLDPTQALLLPGQKFTAAEIEKSLAWQASFCVSFAHQPVFGLVAAADSYLPGSLSRLLAALATSSYPYYHLILQASPASQEAIRQDRAWPHLGPRVNLVSSEKEIAPLLSHANWWSRLPANTRPQSAAFFALAKFLQKSDATLITAHARVGLEGPSPSLLRLPQTLRYSALGQNVYGPVPMASRDLFTAAVAASHHPWMLGLAAENAAATPALLPLFLWACDAHPPAAPSADKREHWLELLNTRSRQLGAPVQGWDFPAENGPSLPRPQPNPASLGVVIPFRDQPGLTCQTLASLAGQSDLGEVTVVLVDNGSSPAALATILQKARQSFAPGKVVHLEAPGPFNFAALNNAGVARLDTDYVLFLNNDIEFTRADDVARLLALACWNGVGLAGPQLLYPDGTLQASGMKFGPAGPQVIRESWEFPDTFGEVDGLTFAVALGARRTILQAGGLDDHLCPNGFGDALLAKRMHTMGLAIIRQPAVQVIHHESKSRGSRPEEMEWFEMWSANIQPPVRFEDFCRQHRHELTREGNTGPRPVWHKRLYRAGRAAWKIWRHR